MEAKTLDDYIASQKSSRPNRGRGGKAPINFQRKRSPYEKRSFNTNKFNNNKREVQFNVKRDIAPTAGRRNLTILGNTSPIKPPISMSSVRKEVSSTLLVRNIEGGINEEDLHELFGAVGEIKSLRLFYDSEGRSEGVALVEYKSSKDALKAIDEYDNRELDNQVLSVVTVSDL